MNRIKKLFLQKERDVLSIYFTAGFPTLNDSVPILKSLEQSGVDMVEIGVPYSDPIADGPTIQSSNQQALENGMTVKTLFEQLDGVRQEVSIPIILMGYVNQIMQYGFENFAKKCSEVGIDGLIIPDLPMHEFRTQFKTVFDQCGLFNIFLISPQTTAERIQEIDQNSDSFIYMVSSANITGTKSDIDEEQISYFSRVESMSLKNPRLIGFGISNHQTFKKACQYASGAIIGSAFIQSIADSKDLKTDIKKFIGSIRNSFRN